MAVQVLNTQTEVTNTLAQQTPAMKLPGQQILQWLGEQGENPGEMALDWIACRLCSSGLWISHPHLLIAYTAQPEACPFPPRSRPDVSLLDFLTAKACRLEATRKLLVGSHMYEFDSMYVYICICAYVCVHTRVCARAYIHFHIYVCVYIHTQNYKDYLVWGYQNHTRKTRCLLASRDLSRGSISENSN